MFTAQHELDLLEHIAKAADSVHQRDLARVSGLSLGMTNSILKRLAQKGWLKIRKINNRNIRYAVSPAGIEAIARRSYGFFRRTVEGVGRCRLAIESYARDLQSLGFREVRLVGKSDLDVIIEHGCQLAGLTFTRTAEAGAAQTADDDERLSLIYAESMGPGVANARNGRRAAFLQDIIGGNPPETGDVS